MEPVERVVATLRGRGHRLTPQREAIIREVMRASGHITPQDIARKVQRRMPAVNASTVYRTLSTLEAIGVVKHSHLESGAGYHRAGEGDHVHLTCSRCGTEDDLSMEEAGSLRDLIRRHRGFVPDLTHFAISGLCARCAAERSAG
jgi:Fur family ferric uptake transcriptional regulator